MSEECKCEKPTLQPQTRQCGKCKLDIHFQRVFKRKGMLLLNQNKLAARKGAEGRLEVMASQSPPRRSNAIY